MREISVIDENSLTIAGIKWSKTAALKPKYFLY